MSEVLDFAQRHQPREALHPFLQLRVLKAFGRVQQRAR
jgi:hypothetical protein